MKYKIMKRQKDKLSHLSTALWHLDLLSSNNQEIEAIKTQLNQVINKETANANV